LNLDGTIVSPANDWNEAYYGKAELPPDIVVRGNLRKHQGDALVAVVSSGAGRG
jgi:hypothetical protein